MNPGINKIFPKPGIQGKLTLIFILLSTIPLILVSLYTVQQQVNFKKSENIREMESDVKGAKERTNLFLTRIESEVMLVMKSTELKRLVNNLQKNMAIENQLRKNAEREFINIVNDNKYYLKIDLLDERGMEVLSIINDKKNPYAVNENDLSKNSKNFYVQMVKNLKPGEIDLSPSEVRIPSSDKFIPVIDFVIPVYDNGKTAAIVTVDVYAEKFFELLLPASALPFTKIYIVNGEGYYIYDSERKDNWNSLFTNRFNENLSSDYPEETASKILTTESMATIYARDRIIQYAPIFSGSKIAANRYFIIEDVSADVIMSSVSELKLLLIALIILVGIVSIAAGFLTAKKFLKPIKQLIKGTQIIRSGNLDYKLEIATHDEIQDLINNFNRLVMEWKQKQMLEKEVRKSEKLISSIAHTATDAIVEIDDKGIVKVWNNSASRIFGYDKKEILNKNIIPLIVPGKYRTFAEKKLKEFINGAADSREGKIIEINALRKDGTEFPAELSISTVTVDENHYVTGIIRDVTQRKRMLQELVEAKNKAEVAHKLKTEFLNQMSHEIRTPLNILLNVSEFIHDDLKEKSILSEDVNENLSEIKSSADRIIRTVELILNMSQIQTGSFENKPVQTDISDLLMKVLSLHRESARQKGLKLNFVNRIEETALFVDPYSLEQVFDHLIDNSLKFTEYGSVNVTLQKDKMNKTIVIVEDTGIGISDQYLSNVFDLFSQEKQGLSRSYEGNGLGLALVKRLCEINNVLINVHSTPGKGTKIILTFPEMDLVFNS